MKRHDDISKSIDRIRERINIKCNEHRYRRGGNNSNINVYRWEKR